MKITRKIFSFLLAAIFIAASFPVTAMAAERGRPGREGPGKGDDMNMYRNSEFIEKEQPELTQETKELISLYQRDPSTENYLNLRDMVIVNYNAVLARKEEKLAELKTETGRLSKIQKYTIGEMQKRGADVHVVKGLAEVKQLLAEIEGRSKPDEV